LFVKAIFFSELNIIVFVVLDNSIRQKYKIFFNYGWSNCTRPNKYSHFRANAIRPYKKWHKLKNLRQMG